jgi:hypothetical protein
MMSSTALEIRGIVKSTAALFGAQLMFHFGFTP